MQSEGRLACVTRHLETARNATIRASLPQSPFEDTDGPGMTENGAYRLIREELVQMATAMRRHVRYIGKLNLWQVSRADGREWAATMAKRSHHPLTRVVIELAAQHGDVVALAKQARADGDVELGIKAEAQRAKVLGEIRQTVAESMKIANDTIKNCESALARVAQMATQVQIHREKLEASEVTASDTELEQIAARAKPAQVALAGPKRLETFLQDPKL